MSKNHAVRYAVVKMSESWQEAIAERGLFMTIEEAHDALAGLPRVNAFILETRSRVIYVQELPTEPTEPHNT